MTETTNNADQVRNSSASKLNQKQDEQTKEMLSLYAEADADLIEERIAEIDKEWDIERALELNAATLALTGTVLGLTVSKKWIALPVIVTIFLIQHAVQGWCPPLPLLRKFGLRSRKEIDKERYALKALRGDFRRTVNSPNKAWNSVQ